MKYQIVEKVFEGENPKSIFEVGCANGMLLEDYALEHEVIVGGLEISAPSIQNCKERFKTYKDNFYTGDAQLPFLIPDNSFDIVYTIGTLILIPNPFPTIKEMLRIAKVKIILAEPHDEGLDEYGAYGDVPQPDNYTGIRIPRNYIKVFEKLNLPMTLEDSGLGKWIIKCVK